jgi:hypothetical protein
MNGKAFAALRFGVLTLNSSSDSPIFLQTAASRQDFRRFDQAAIA